MPADARPRGPAEPTHHGPRVEAAIARVGVHAADATTAAASANRDGDAGEPSRVPGAAFARALASLPAQATPVPADTPGRAPTAAGSRPGLPPVPPPPDDDPPAEPAGVETPPESGISLSRAALAADRGHRTPAEAPAGHAARAAVAALIPPHPSPVTTPRPQHAEPFDSLSRAQGGRATQNASPSAPAPAPRATAAPAAATDSLRPAASGLPPRAAAVSASAASPTAAAPPTPALAPISGPSQTARLPKLAPLRPGTILRPAPSAAPAAPTTAGAPGATVQAPPPSRTAAAPVAPPPPLPTRAAAAGPPAKLTGPIGSSAASTRALLAALVPGAAPAASAPPPSARTHALASPPATAATPRATAPPGPPVTARMPAPPPTGAGPGAAGGPSRSGLHRALTAILDDAPEPDAPAPSTTTTARPAAATPPPPGPALPARAADSGATPARAGRPTRTESVRRTPPAATVPAAAAKAAPAAATPTGATARAAAAARPASATARVPSLRPLTARHANALGPAAGPGTGAPVPPAAATPPAPPPTLAGETTNEFEDLLAGMLRQREGDDPLPRTRSAPPATPPLAAFSADRQMFPAPAGEANLSDFVSRILTEIDAMVGAPRSPTETAGAAAPAVPVNGGGPPKPDTKARERAKKETGEFEEKPAAAPGGGRAGPTDPARKMNTDELSALADLFDDRDGRPVDSAGGRS